MSSPTLQVKGILFDIDGVLHVGNDPLPGAADAIARVRDAGVGLCFLTNTTRKPRRLILERMSSMGIDVREEELLTPSRIALEWLKEENRLAHLLIHPDLAEDFEGVADGDDAAVLLGDAADGFTYEALNECFRRIMDGAPFLAMARNRYFRESDGLSLDMGAYVVGLEYATGKEAVTLGKPSSKFFETALSIVGCEASEAAMIGDDVEADVNGAVKAGLIGMLVRTGKYSKGDDSRLAKDGFVEDDVAAAVERLLGEKS